MVLLFSLSGRGFTTWASQLQSLIMTKTSLNLRLRCVRVKKSADLSMAALNLVDSYYLTE